MKTLLLAALVLGVGVATAAADTQAPYAGWQERGIKALSPQQIDDLRKGRGMSLALPAELNGYPGPRHALDLGDDLALSAEQRAALEALFAEMQSAAQELGAEILQRESALDMAFLHGGLGEAELQRDLAALAALQGELRFVHLRAHLAARALMSEDQVARYNALRGYGSTAMPDHGGASGHGGHQAR